MLNLFLSKSFRKAIQDNRFFNYYHHYSRTSSSIVNDDHQYNTTTIVVDPIHNIIDHNNNEDHDDDVNCSSQSNKNNNVVITHGPWKSISLIFIYVFVFVLTCFPRSTDETFVLFPGERKLIDVDRHWYQELRFENGFDVDVYVFEKSPPAFNDFVTIPSLGSKNVTIKSGTFHYERFSSAPGTKVTFNWNFTSVPITLSSSHLFPIEIALDESSTVTMQIILGDESFELWKSNQYIPPSDMILRKDQSQVTNFTFEIESFDNYYVVFYSKNLIAQFEGFLDTSITQKTWSLSSSVPASLVCRSPIVSPISSCANHHVRLWTPTYILLATSSVENDRVVSSGGRHDKVNDSHSLTYVGGTIRVFKQVRYISYAYLGLSILLFLFVFMLWLKKVEYTIKKKYTSMLSSYYSSDSSSSPSGSETMNMQEVREIITPNNCIDEHYSSTTTENFDDQA